MPTPVAAIFDDLKAVDYPDGAVVSREIRRKPTGNVTLFAFDEGQGLSEHTAPFDALAQVLEGDAEISIAGQPHRVRSGELILMPAGQPHALKAFEGFGVVSRIARVEERQGGVLERGHLG